VGLTYRTFDDDQIGTTNPQSIFDTVISVGDFLYDVKLDYSNMSKMTFNAQCNVKYHLNEQLAFSILLSFAGRISGVYDLDITTREEDEVLPPDLILQHYTGDPYILLGSVVTNYLNLGVGVTYKF
jgi:hypothetical protein